VASGAKTDRAQLRRLLDVLDAGDVLTVTRLDRLARSTRDLLNTLAAITAKKAGFKSHWRRVGRHHDIARALDADRARRAGGVRARSYPRAHRRRPRAGRGARAENGPTAQTNAAPEAAIRRRDTGDKTLADIGRSYNVSPATISRLMA
jgi:DNA invertase Pin-like site-specific DNA recombinase